MPWTERQRRMLEEMGIRLWMPAPVALPAGAAHVPDDGASPVRQASVPHPSAPIAPPSTGRAAVPRGPTSTPETAPDAGRMIDLDALDAAALAAHAAVCTACSLCAGRSHSVFASGDLQA